MIANATPVRQSGRLSAQCIGQTQRSDAITHDAVRLAVILIVCRDPATGDRALGGLPTPGTLAMNWSR
jgi:hypothetical protein